MLFPSSLVRRLVAACLLSAPLAAQVSETLELSLDPAPGQQFGASVAMWTDRVLVGAPGDDRAGIDAGAAFLQERQPDGSWITAATLVASDAAPGDAFGSSVAIFGDLAVVGAALDDAPAVDAGSAYVFVRQLDGTWAEAAHLVASDAAAFDTFGGAMALWVGTVVIGATGDDVAAGGADPLDTSGAVYLFQQQLDGSWPQVVKLDTPGQGPLDLLGTSVSINGARLIAGAPGHAGTGAAYVYESQGGLWPLTHTFQADVPAAGDEFGIAVSVSGSRAMAAAPGEGDGVAYVFRQVSGVWGLEDKLSGSDVGPADGFARHALLAGDRVLVGAALQGAGASYLFERQGDATWLQVEKLLPSAATAGAQFGHRGVVFEERALVGAPQDAGAGSAFLFQLTPLQIDTPIVDVISGGTQTFFLDAGHLHAGRIHWLLGTASGSTPGVTFASGAVLPLNPDAYLSYTLTNPNTPPLAGSLGLLDEHGLATATFTLPPGSPPSILGLPVFHAFVVLQQQTGQLRFVSNAQATLLTL